MTGPDYVHGYSGREAERLADQADTLAALLHDGVAFPAGDSVLEPGCGVGSQTVHLAVRSPGAHIVAVDLSAASIAEARRRLANAGAGNVSFLQADIHRLPFDDASFDHVFVCFLLEHLPEPERALRNLRGVLRGGGSITVIEGDHGSWHCYPSTPEAERTVACLVEIQAGHGGDALIGRSLYPLLTGTGFHTVHVSPRLVYVDDSRPDLAGGFSRNTFIAMVEGVREQALELGLMDEASWDKGIADMHKAAEPGGTFSYTFFKGTALK
ncbi:MAG: methyltransferase domain-containing protein [Gaiellaceae bacterium]